MTLLKASSWASCSDERPRRRPFGQMFFATCFMSETLGWALGILLPTLLCDWAAVTHNSVSVFSEAASPPGSSDNNGKGYPAQQDGELARGPPSEHNGRFVSLLPNGNALQRQASLPSVLEGLQRKRSFLTCFALTPFRVGSIMFVYSALLLGKRSRRVRPPRWSGPSEREPRQHLWGEISAVNAGEVAIALASLAVAAQRLRAASERSNISRSLSDPSWAASNSPGFVPGPHEERLPHDDCTVLLRRRRSLPGMDYFCVTAPCAIRYSGRRGCTTAAARSDITALRPQATLEEGDSPQVMPSFCGRTAWNVPQRPTYHLQRRSSSILLRSILPARVQLPARASSESAITPLFFEPTSSEKVKWCGVAAAVSHAIRKACESPSSDPSESTEKYLSSRLMETARLSSNALSVGFPATPNMALFKEADSPPELSRKSSTPPSRELLSGEESPAERSGSSKNSQKGKQTRTKPSGRLRLLKKLTFKREPNVEEAASVTADLYAGWFVPRILVTYKERVQQLLQKPEDPEFVHSANQVWEEMRKRNARLVLSQLLQAIPDDDESMRAHAIEQIMRWTYMMELMIKADFRQLLIEAAATEAVKDLGGISPQIEGKKLLENRAYYKCYVQACAEAANHSISEAYSTLVLTETTQLRKALAVHRDRLTRCLSAQKLESLLQHAASMYAMDILVENITLSDKALVAVAVAFHNLSLLVEEVCDSERLATVIEYTRSTDLLARIKSKLFTSFYDKTQSAVREATDRLYSSYKSDLVLRLQPTNDRDLFRALDNIFLPVVREVVYRSVHSEVGSVKFGDWNSTKPLLQLLDVLTQERTREAFVQYHVEEAAYALPSAFFESLASTFRILSKQYKWLAYEETSKDSPTMLQLDMFYMQELRLLNLQLSLLVTLLAVMNIPQNAAFLKFRRAVKLSMKLICSLTRAKENSEGIRRIAEELESNAKDLAAARARIDDQPK